LCSDTTRISLFENPDTCNDDDIENSCCGSDHQDQSPTKEDPIDRSCGCNKVELIDIKLSNHIDECSSPEYSFTNQFSFLQYTTSSQVIPESLPEIVINSENYSPPGNYLYGRNLINFINQLKIPLYS